MASPTRSLGSFLLLVIVLAATREAPAQHRAFLERMQQWEKETGQTSRMTHYARIDTLGLPEADPAATEAVNRYLDSPATTDPSPFAGLLQQFLPAFDILAHGWGVQGVGTFEYRDAKDPVPNFLNVQLTAKLLCCRALAYESQGQLDHALADLASVWLFGYTLEQSQATLITTLMGYFVRVLALRHLGEVITRRELSDDQLTRLHAMFAAHPPARTSVTEAMSDELVWAGAWIANEHPDQKTCIDEGVRRVLTALREVREASPERRREASERCEEVGREVGSSCVPLQGMVPSAGQGVLRQNSTHALESVVITMVVVTLANRRAGGAATDAQIAEAAGPLAPFMTDPFTGKPLLVVNRGGSEVAVVSTGPDLKADASGWTYYDVKAGWDGGGDIFLSRLK